MTAVLSLGNNYKISLQDVFAQSRQKLVDNLQLQDTSTVVFLNGGPDQTRYDSDHEPIFRRESYFLWLNCVQKLQCRLCRHDYAQQH